MFQFQLMVCDACKNDKAMHAEHDGKFYVRDELQSVGAPDGCQCSFRITGKCGICDIEAQDIGTGAEKSVDLILKQTAPDGTMVPRRVSICGHCVIGLVQTFGNMSQNGQLQVILTALQPTIIPASKIIPPGGNNVIPGRFGRH